MKKSILLFITFLVIGGASYAFIRSSRAAHSMAALTQGPSLSTMFYPTNISRFRDLRHLVARSPEIVVGVPVSKSSSSASAGNQMIYTDYEVRVLLTLKGDRHPGRIITLRVPGGATTLDSGKTKEVRAPDFWKNPEVGKAYVFFTRKKRDTPSQLVGGPQGLFQISPWSDSFDLSSPPDISSGRTIVPQALDSDELMRKYNGRSAALFLGEIRKIIRTNSPSFH